MYNCLFTVLFMFCISVLDSILSGDHFCRFGIALHAHVQVYLTSPCIVLPSAVSLSRSYFGQLLRMCSTLNQGVSSHKKIPKEQSWLLRQYYENNIVLFLMCAGNELFFVSIYLLSFPPPPNSPPRLGISDPLTEC